MMRRALCLMAICKRYHLFAGKITAFILIHQIFFQKNYFFAFSLIFMRSARPGCGISAPPPRPLRPPRLTILSLVSLSRLVRPCGICVINMDADKIVY